MNTTPSADSGPPRGCQLFAATAGGPEPLAEAPTEGELNDAFDALPLGIYEGLRTVDGTRLIALPEHLRRAERSLERMGWSYTLDRTILCECLSRILDEVGTTESRVRFDILSEEIATSAGSTRIVIGVAPLTLPGPDAYRSGVGVQLLRELERGAPLIKDATFVVQRRPFPLGGPEAYERLLVDASDRLLECTASSFFGVQGGRILTAGEGVLEGVTSGIVAGLAARMEVDFVERDMFTGDLSTFDEAFLTSSIKGVVPVVRVDGEPIAGGSPGPITLELIERYNGFIDERARPARDAIRMDGA